MYNQAETNVWIVILYRIIRAKNSSTLKTVQLYKTFYSNHYVLMCGLSYLLISHVFNDILCAYVFVKYVFNFFPNIKDRIENVKVTSSFFLFTNKRYSVKIIVFLKRSGRVVENY